MTGNVAASVHQRLLNIARADNRRFNDVLQHYALERWLYRLSISPHVSRFILKGALAMNAWQVPVTRPTRDIDLLARVANDPESVKVLIGEICSTSVQDDGLLFDAGAVTTVRIAEDAEYEGVRASFPGALGNARIAMQIDLGFSDIVTPEPTVIEYPTLLDMPAPRLRAYNAETAIAEKLEAMIKLGELNSRVKDFFDVWVLAATQSFDGSVLEEAVRRTLEQRGTQLSVEAVCFRREYVSTGAKQAQWRAFISRSELDQAPAEFEEVWSAVVAFLRPVVEAILDRRSVGTTWDPGGPWR